MPTILLSLTDTDAARLERWAAAQGVSVAVFVLQALAAYGPHGDGVRLGDLLDPDPAHPQVPFLALARDEPRL